MTLILRMVNGKAVGPDRLPSEFLKAAPASNAIWLQALMHFFWCEGMVPSIWRLTFLHPIYKGVGPRTEGANYRGIALMSHLRKTYEYAVRIRTEEVVGPRTAVQYGFVSGRSIWAPIWGLHQELRSHSRAEATPQLLLVDIEKAYDTVDRNILWEKLERRAGGDSRLIQMIRELADSNEMIIRDAAPGVGRVLCERGLPQGSNLSPVLYTYFIDDLPEALGLERGASCKMYADDIAICTTGRDRSVAELQGYCDRLMRYADAHGFRISSSKTVLLGGPPCIINRLPVLTKPQARYLGVPFTIEGGNFEAAQIGALTNAQRTLRQLCDIGMMGQAFDAGRRLHLVKCFVISKLDFATGLPCTQRTFDLKSRLYDEAISTALGNPRALNVQPNGARWLTDNLRGTTGLYPYRVRRDVAAARVTYQAFGAGVPWFPCRELLDGNQLFDSREDPAPCPNNRVRRAQVRRGINHVAQEWAKRNLTYRPLGQQSPVWERSTEAWVRTRWIPMMRASEPRKQGFRPSSQADVHPCEPTATVARSDLGKTGGMLPATRWGWLRG